jgi:hypothetical protein
MDNRLLLDQARRGINAQIRQSPTTVSLKRKRRIPDGLGGLMDDPSDTGTEFFFRVRISHERSGVQTELPVPSGQDTSLSKWMLFPWNFDIREDEIITDQDRSYKIGKIDALRKFEGVIALQAPLIPAGTISDGIVTGVTLEDGPIDLSVSDTYQLTAVVTPLGAINQDLTWQSSDEDIATVDADGLVTAVGLGSATITVTTVDQSKTDTVVIEVGT